MTDPVAFAVVLGVPIAIALLIACAIVLVVLDERKDRP